jgi:hypothetical protein
VSPDAMLGSRNASTQHLSGILAMVFIVTFGGFAGNYAI